jgi:hypothetical protein
VLVVLALLLPRWADANTPGPRCTSQHAFLNETPDDKEPGWHDRVQGITHDESAWYISQNVSAWEKVPFLDDGDRPRLWRIPVWLNLANDVKCGKIGVQCRYFHQDRDLEFNVGGVDTSVRDLFNEGYSHFGDIAFDGGHLFAPLQDREPKEVSLKKKAIIAVYNPKLELRAIGETTSVIAGWLAGGQEKAHVLYTSDWSQVGEVRRYHYDRDQLDAGQLELTELAPVPLVTPLGHPYVVNFVQGGVLSDDGNLLYLSTGFTKGVDVENWFDDDGNNGGIRVFELSDTETGGPCTDAVDSHCTATLIESSTNTSKKHAKFAYRYNSSVPDKDEPEGMTYWDLDKEPDAHRAMSGQVHALLLDRDDKWYTGWEDDSVNLKHYTAEIDCAQEPDVLRIEGRSETGDRIGHAFATGDFDGDGHRDLAMTVAGEGAGGGVSVAYGSATGITAASQTITQNAIWVPGSDDPGDGFGHALAAGDFDQDGFDDLAIGVPFEDGYGRANSGRIVVVYGSDGGLRGRAIAFDQNSAYVNGGVETGDGFGFSLASGDFDDDGYSDLAVGVPHESVSGVAAAGMIHAFYGSSAGLSALRETIFGEWYAEIADQPTHRDRFGWSLVSADFNRDSFDDLAIGVPWGDPNGVNDAGAVHVIWGSASGISATTPPNTSLRYLHQAVARDGFYVAGMAEQGDLFGYSLAAGDFDRNGYQDLAIGVPYEDVNRQVDAGAVNVLYGDYGGLKVRGNQAWNQDMRRIEDQCEPYDTFGFSLTAADFDGDGTSDLAVGVPHESIGKLGQAGMVNVIYGHWWNRLNWSKNWAWHQRYLAGADSEQLESWDFFGHALVGDDFDGDGRAELVVGAPGEARRS